MAVNPQGQQGDNRLSPTGITAVHIPTFLWAVVAFFVAIILYHVFFK